MDGTIIIVAAGPNGVIITASASAADAFPGGGQGCRPAFRIAKCQCNELTREWFCLRNDIGQLPSGE
jgi:hypothetical protein